MKTTSEAITPLLVEVSGKLDETRRLASLAEAFGASPFQFHRLFSAATGETPARHLKRLRLERAAYLLAVTDTPVLEVALSVGFETHEAFSRAFKRRFGHTPRGYRKSAKSAQRARMQASHGFTGDGCRISDIRIHALRPLKVLAVRCVGAYADQDRAARRAVWTELEALCARQGVSCAGARLGLYPDDPTLTPAVLQQSDLCLSVSAPVAVDGRVRTLDLAGGTHAAIDHLGPHGTLPQAYSALADAVRRSERYVLCDGPPIHLFLNDGEAVPSEAVRSRICFPVRSRR